MATEHPNVSLLEQFDPHNLQATPELFAPSVVFHYFNPQLPDVQGEHVCADGIQSFFEEIGLLTGRTFQVEPVSIAAVGDKLVVTQTKNRMVIQEQESATDVVVVWRIVDGRIAEIWDIPSVHAGASQTNS